MSHRPTIRRIVYTVGCRCCGRDVGTIIDRASFCPDCGHPLPDDDVTLLERMYRGLAWLRQSFRRSTPRSADPTCTPIITGYGNAMLSLGWRYESGMGAFRNLPEALRCYRKSARLGNLDAMMRLPIAEANDRPVMSEEAFNATLSLKSPDPFGFGTRRLFDVWL